MASRSGCTTGSFRKKENPASWEGTPHGVDMTFVEVQRLYQNRFSERDRRMKHQVWGVIVRSFFQRWIAPQQVVLDLGCGGGEFLTHIRCARRIGVDVNPDASSSLDDTIEFHRGDIC